MTNALISVIVPCFNQSDTILRTLESVRAQTYNHWECIVVDDGSTDDSLEKISVFIKDDARFRAINIPNGGVSAARNLAVEQAVGTMLFPLDGDDYLHPECLSRCFRIFNERPGMRLVCPQGIMFGAAEGPWILPPFDYKTMLKYNMIHNSCLFFKADFVRVGGYRVNMTRGFEDWDFLIVMLYGMPEGSVHQLQENLFFYRVKAASRRLTLDRSGYREQMSDLIVYNNFKIYREYFPDILTRIIDYDFNKTILSKPPVRLLTRVLIGLSGWKQKFRLKHSANIG